jgi:hypothetical protein
LAQYHLTVTSLCREHYLRNNKRGGLKNMRCFPECLQAGHHSKGFCGHRVTAVCNSERPLPNGTILVGSFVTWDEKRNITDDVSFKIGDEIKISDLAKNTRKYKYSQQTITKEIFVISNTYLNVTTTINKKKTI